MFKRIVTSALFAGFAVGLIAALLQLVFVEPTLLHAELFESGALVHSGTAGSSARVEVGETDLLRNGLSILFSAVLFTGYSLILLAAMTLASERGAKISTRQGILWGLAGYVTVQFAPAFGLPPELPGMSAADLVMRQVWWIGTVAATGVAIWLIAFGRNWPAWIASVVLLSLPHIIGAPHPEIYYGSVPPELATTFAGRTLGVGMIDWTLLGLFAAYFWQREGGDSSTPI